MKTAKLFILCLVGILLGALAYGVFVDRSSPIHIDNVFSDNAAEAVQPAIVSPIDVVFYDITDVVEAQTETIEEAGCLYTFRNLSLSTLRNITCVLLDKGVPLTIRNIINEYNTNADIYDPISANEEQISPFASYAPGDLPRGDPSPADSTTTAVEPSK